MTLETSFLMESLRFICPPLQVLYYSEKPFMVDSGHFHKQVEWTGDIMRKDASITLRNVKFSYNGTFTCRVTNAPDVHGRAGELRLRVVTSGQSDTTLIFSPIFHSQLYGEGLWETCSPSQEAGIGKHPDWDSRPISGKRHSKSVYVELACSSRVGMGFPLVYPPTVQKHAKVTWSYQILYLHESCVFSALGLHPILGYSLPYPLCLMNRLRTPAILYGTGSIEDEWMDEWTERWIICCSLTASVSEITILAAAIGGGILLMLIILIAVVAVKHYQKKHEDIEEHCPSEKGSTMW